MQQVSIHRNLLKLDDLAYLKSKVDKLHIIEKESSGLNNLKSKLDELDVDKLSPIPIYLSKVSDIEKNEGFKKDAYDKLIKKVIAIDTSKLVSKQIKMQRSKILKIKY